MLTIVGHRYFFQPRIPVGPRLFHSIIFNMHNTLRALKNTFFLATLITGSAHAEVRQIFFTGTAGQSSFKVENYMGNSIAIWNTPSTCQGGLVTLPASATADDRSRLYSTVIAAKTGRMTMFIYYDDQPTGCVIVSFGIL